MPNLEPIQLINSEKPKQLHCDTNTFHGMVLSTVHCFCGGSVVKNLPASARDKGWIPGLGRSPREGNGNPLQYSCLGNPKDRGAWQATVHGVVKELDLI